MGEVTIQQILDVASKITITGILVLILVGGKKKWWVWGYQLDELRADMREQLADSRAETKEWKAVALRNLRVTEQVVKPPEIPERSTP